MHDNITNVYKYFKPIPKNYIRMNIVNAYITIKLGKEKCNKWETTIVVYKNCCLYCDASYVGQTKRSLKERIKEHQNNKSLESVLS